jgi:hypothetical protein
MSSRGWTVVAILFSISALLQIVALEAKIVRGSYLQGAQDHFLGKVECTMLAGEAVCKKLKTETEEKTQ